jgi:hypothetical protein
MKGGQSMMPSRFLSLLALGLFTFSTACAELDQTLNSLQLPVTNGILDERTIAAGLKEALQVGTGNAVTVTGTPAGYFRNQAIKLLLPEQLQSFEQGLRTLGYGRQVDEFVLSLNRAAERAAPQAKQIFWTAITEMTFADAKQILNGADTAATDYFRVKTRDRLAAAFRPTVERSMNEVGVTRQYKDLTARLKAIPLVKREALDLDQYVVAKSIDGLFLMLGREEKNIRLNPSARVSNLLKRVFARQGS